MTTSGESTSPLIFTDMTLSFAGEDFLLYRDNPGEHGIDRVVCLHPTSLGPELRCWTAEFDCGTDVCSLLTRITTHVTLSHGASAPRESR